MTKRFLLLPKPAWVGFTLKQEGETDERDFSVIAEALDYVRKLPDSKGAQFVVLDEKGKEMAQLTV